MDFDTDGCYNTPAIDANGYLNPGLDINDSPAPEGGCRDEIDLRNNNVYSRSRCNNGWCGYMYGYYFEKDKSTHDGHRHDWEHIIVWTQDDQPKYVAASAHGGYDLRHWDDVTKHDGTHPKIVYHKDGILTHAFRFEKPGGEFPENHDKEWFVSHHTPFLKSWQTLTFSSSGWRSRRFSRIPFPRDSRQDDEQRLGIGSSRHE